MSYNTNMDTITVNDVEYDVQREQDGASAEETLTITLFNVDTDEDEAVFDGLEGTLGYEESGEDFSPRDWCNVGTMAVSYRGYDLGDEDIEKIDFEVECPVCKGDGWRDFGDEGEKDCGNCDGRGYIDLHPADYFKKECGARVVIGLTVYEHSGITMYAGNVTVPFDQDRWDTSFVGFIYDTPEKVKECIGNDATDEQIEKMLRSEVAVYASYLEGDITWYSVEDSETNFLEGCGGFVGSHEECESECFAALEQAIIKRLSEGDERAEWNARGTQTK